MQQVTRIFPPRWAHLAFSLLLASPGPAAIPGPVRTEAGLVQGVSGPDDAVTVFRAIPFAAPPVGNLRWQAPKPPSEWAGVRKTTEFSAACMQVISRSKDPWTEEFMHQGEVSEDCLYLNVWTAAKSAGEKRPVMLWIYGGGFVEGSGSIAAYDGEELARKGIIVVSANYRVGVFGFLAHPELSRESSAPASGNYGLFDQLAALRWIQKNIQAFGGDPAQVTIVGQSAGAASVHALTASPLATGLFHRAIAQSGSAVGRPMRKLEDAEADGLKFAAAKGAGSLKELRSLPAADLMARVLGAAFSFRPIVDGRFLTHDIAEVFRTGKQNDVPTLTGITADEGGGPNYAKLSPEEFEKQVRQRFGDQADAFLKLYPIAGPEQARLAQKSSARDQGLVSMYLWARERARTAKTPAYLYYWNHATPGPNSAAYGAFHTSDVTFTFNSLRRAKRPWTAADHRVAETVSTYWANFIATGNPKGKGLPEWPAYEAGKAVVMELGSTFRTRPIADRSKLEFFESQLMPSAPK